MDTELIITFAQENTYWLGLTASNWISILVAIPAAIAVGIGLGQWYSTNQANKRSHTPFLKSTLRHPDADKPGQVVITNSGLGPAFLKEVNLRAQGEEIPGPLREACDEVIRRINEQPGVTLEAIKHYSYQKDHPIAQYEEIGVMDFVVREAPSYDEVDDVLKDLGIQLEVVYEDIYQRKHTKLDPQEGLEI